MRLRFAAAGGVSAVVGMLLVAVAAAGPSARDAGLPLANLHITGGQRPAIQKTDAGFVVRNEAGITAAVQAPRDAFLCRVGPGENRDVVQFSLGRVDSARCNALFSPSRDLAIEFVAPRVRLRWTGHGYALAARGPLKVVLHRDYMKKERGLKWFTPLDKSVFKTAPAGWCSWYVFYQGVTEKVMVKNTDWLAEHLKKFGCEYVQLDDGWQGRGHGLGDNRDWYTTAKNKFPHGMKWLASYIRSKGLKPGIWVIPCSTSDEDLFRHHPEMFIRRPDGTSIGEKYDKSGKLVGIDWTGRFLVDPTHPLGKKWFHDLFRMLCHTWGYQYVKIDGQWGYPGFLRHWHKQLHDPNIPPDEAYRLALSIIRKTMGRDKFLLNCGLGFDSCGICDGIRIGGDVGASWSRMQPAIRSTMRWVFLNNIAFFTDPDVVCVRQPGSHGSSLTLDQARMWATLVGITGQLLMASDDMPELTEERIELLRRIFPTTPIRPMDLYPFSGRPRIFDLRVNKPAVGQWDVVAVFNWDARQAATVWVRPRDLGLPAGRYLVYDFWGKQFLGTIRQGLPLRLAPASCKVIVLHRFAAHPQLLATSRHITCGYFDLHEARWDPASGIWRGRSDMVAGDPYQLVFTLPPGWQAIGDGIEVRGPLAVLTVRRPRNETVSWRVRFRRTAAKAEVPTVSNAAVAGDRRKVTISWRGSGALAYRVYRNGRLIGQTSEQSFIDYVSRKGVPYRYEVAPVGWQGEGKRVVAGEYVRRTTPRGTAPDAWLDQLDPVTFEQDWGTLRRRRSVEGNPIRIAGKTYKHGLGTHANSKILYALDNRYSRFEAWVGVDDEKHGQGTVEFMVYLDGELAWRSGKMKGGQPAKKVSIPLDGVDELLLVVTDAGDGISCDHADWADARLIGNK